MPANAFPLSHRVKFGAISWRNYFHLASVLIWMPFDLTVKALYSPFSNVSPAYAAKLLKKRILHSVGQYLLSSLSVSEIQWAAGSGVLAYQRWTKQNKLHSVIDKLDSSGSSGHLLWIGPKRTDKVILYFPPGGYYVPVLDIVFKFWRYAQLEWKKQGLEVGVVILSYSVLPEDVFPTQLYQATQAINHLLGMGCDPSNICLAGDSAGGNLLFQLFSHMLHPLPSCNVPPLELPSGKRLNSALSMSAWVSLSNPEQWGNSFRSNAHCDVMPGIIKEWGQSYIAYVPDSHIVYADPALVPDGWYSELTNLVDRVFVIAGAEERFRDQIVSFYKNKIKPHHDGARLEVQEGGVHGDLLLDFAISDVPIEITFTMVVLDWIAEGFW
ncbi:hypothetical protein GYMLUDRAFT_239197 [Collybiopsis luxurians FD-317 M1]|nr:hypothetical protein GYMLUDRAFT_239197 [Collybiopsis luxurians FD-317 M1]